MSRGHPTPTLPRPGGQRRPHGRSCPPPGILFVGFDGDEAVAEARIGDGPWGAAQVVG